MTREEIFAVVCEQVVVVLPHLSPNKISIEGRLKDYGANSIDRAEIVTMTLEALRLRIPPSDLVQASNLRALVDLLHSRLAAGS